MYRRGFAVIVPYNRSINIERSLSCRMQYFYIFISIFFTSSDSFKWSFVQIALKIRAENKIWALVGNLQIHNNSPLLSFLNIGSFQKCFSSDCFILINQCGKDVYCKFLIDLNVIFYIWHLLQWKLLKRPISIHEDSFLILHAKLPTVH